MQKFFCFHHKRKAFQSNVLAFKLQNITIGILNNFQGYDYSSFVHYNFLNGFEPGNYEFSDFYTNFGIVAQVLDTGSEVYFLTLVCENARR